MANNKAALYLRSSKDRSDVSIDAQRRELQRLAADRGLIIVAEFSDVVISGSETAENRPGLQNLLSEMGRSARSWDTVLILDTSRLARRPQIAVMFEMDAEKAGVTVVYKTLPEDDAAMKALFKSVMRGIDEWHSLTSRKKGLAGMAENVKKGFRAGGRAPRGYRLLKFETGAIREGEPVVKSKLEPDENAELVGTFLKQRSIGIPRAALARQLKLPWPENTLVCMEWNALQYAGHTVWNVHNEAGPDGYKGGTKRRPRSEWVIQRNTHQGLITDSEAETLLLQLEQSKHGAGRRTSATYLLTGLLKTPADTPWYGEAGGKYYRTSEDGRSKSVTTAAVDEVVLAQIGQDLTSPHWVKAAVETTRRQLCMTNDTEIEEANEQIQKINQRISRFMDMAGELESPGPVLRKINELEKERETLAAHVVKLEREDEEAKALSNIGDAQVKRMLVAMAEQMKTYSREDLKDFLTAMLQRIDLDPLAMTLQLHYRIPLTSRNKVASPRGFEPRLPP